MINEKYRSEILYQASLLKFKELLKARLITAADYEKVDQFLKERFRPFISILDDGDNSASNSLESSSLQSECQ